MEKSATNAFIIHNKIYARVVLKSPLSKEVVGIGFGPVTNGLAKQSLTRSISGSGQHFKP